MRKRVGVGAFVGYRTAICSHFFGYLKEFGSVRDFRSELLINLLVGILSGIDRINQDAVLNIKMCISDSGNQPDLVIDLLGLSGINGLPEIDPTQLQRGVVVVRVFGYNCDMHNQNDK